MNTHTLKNGFTLVELIFTLAIGLIFLTLAVPSFTTLTKNNRVTTVTNELITDINLARSEALNRGVRVILCRSNNTSSASPTCGGTANTWTDGWLVFASGDTDDDYDAGTDTLIRVSQAGAGGNVTIKSNNVTNNNLQYNPDGTTNEGGNTGIFAVCDDRGLAHGNQIQIISTGRPRLIAPVPSSCSSPS